MKDVLEAIKSRRSVRIFKKQQVERSVLEKLIEHAACAPTAGNRQDWFFTICINSEVIKQIAAMSQAAWKKLEIGQSGLSSSLASYGTAASSFENAPALIVVSCRAAGAMERQFFGDSAEAVFGGIASAAMAAQNLILAAHALGLGACVMTAPLIAEEEIKTLLELPKRNRMVCVVAAGHPTEDLGAVARKPLTKIMRFVE